MTLKRKIRQTQTIVPFGVGGIFDIRGESFVAADITTWGKRGTEITSRRLAEKLGVQQFRAAPVAPDGKRQYAPGMPGPVYARFPKWLFCPRCRRMVRWRPTDEERDKAPSCGRCSGTQQLAPMRFIQICRHGHMADIDWVRWAHSTAETPEQKQCAKTFLDFTVRSVSGGLESLRVRCQVCKSYRSLRDITRKDVLSSIGLACTGRQPWQRVEDREECA